ncbi:MAG: hypothetical protein K0S27_1210 [Gammaproteobacteria bacterium]|nr:hypothetical protein [Gammaproteobacteria bacterium]
MLPSPYGEKANDFLKEKGITVFYAEGKILMSLKCSCPHYLDIKTAAFPQLIAGKEEQESDNQIVMEIGQSSAAMAGTFSQLFPGFVDCLTTDLANTSLKKNSEAKGGNENALHSQATLFAIKASGELRKGKKGSAALRLLGESVMNATHVVTDSPEKEVAIEGLKKNAKAARKLNLLGEALISALNILVVKVTGLSLQREGFKKTNFFSKSTLYSKSLDSLVKTISPEQERKKSHKR